MRCGPPTTKNCVYCDRAPARRGRPAKPFYNFPVLSSTAAKPAAPVHPAPGTQLPFAGATNFRELGGYPADEGKTVRWGQIWRGVCTARLTDPADRARLDALGLRLILDLRSTAEACGEPASTSGAPLRRDSVTACSAVARRRSRVGIS